MDGGMSFTSNLGMEFASQIDQLKHESKGLREEGARLKREMKAIERLNKAVTNDMVKSAATQAQMIKLNQLQESNFIAQQRIKERIQVARGAPKGVSISRMREVTMKGLSGYRALSGGGGISPELLMGGIYGLGYGAGYGATKLQKGAEWLKSNLVVTPKDLQIAHKRFIANGTYEKFVQHFTSLTPSEKSRVITRMKIFGTISEGISKGASIASTGLSAMATVAGGAAQYLPVAGQVVAAGLLVGAGIQAVREQQAQEGLKKSKIEMQVANALYGISNKISPGDVSSLNKIESKSERLKFVENLKRKIEGKRDIHISQEEIGREIRQQNRMSASYLGGKFGLEVWDPRTAIIRNFYDLTNWDWGGYEKKLEEDAKDTLLKKKVDSEKAFDEQKQTMITNRHESRPDTVNIDYRRELLWETVRSDRAKSVMEAPTF